MEFATVDNCCQYRSALETAYPTLKQHLKGFEPVPLPPANLIFALKVSNKEDVAALEGCFQYLKHHLDIQPPGKAIPVGFGCEWDELDGERVGKLRVMEIAIESPQSMYQRFPFSFCTDYLSTAMVYIIQLDPFLLQFPMPLNLSWSTRKR